MTLNDFIKKWQGKYIDFDGVYGAQCMDLMHQYCVEVLGISDGRVLAKDYAKNVFLDFDNTFGHEFFNKIENSLLGVPKEGDIVFWSSNPYGHVAVFIEGDIDSFRSFDANYPLGSPCHIQEHKYNNVIGWLHPQLSKTILNQAQNTTLPTYLSTLLQENNLDLAKEGQIRDWFEQARRFPGIKTDLENALKEIEKLAGQIADLENDVAKLKVEKEKLEQSLLLARNVSPISTYTLPQETATTVPEASITVTTAEDDEKPGPEWLTNFFKWLGRKF